MIAVVDASVLVAAFVDSADDGPWSERVIAGGGLVSPELVLVETANILRRHARSGQLSRAEAGLAYGSLLRLKVELFPFMPFAERVWELGENLTSYDAWYVALAEALDCPLITLDRKIGRAAGPTCQIITPPDS